MTVATLKQELITRFVEGWRMTIEGEPYESERERFKLADDLFQYLHNCVTDTSEEIPSWVVVRLSNIARACDGAAEAIEATRKTALSAVEQLRSDGVVETTGWRRRQLAESPEPSLREAAAEQERTPHA